MPSLRIAVCDAEDAEKWNGFTEAFFTDAFGRGTDVLTIFKLPHGQMPSLEDVEQGVVLVPRCRAMQQRGECGARRWHDAHRLRT